MFFYPPPVFLQTYSGHKVQLINWCIFFAGRTTEYSIHCNCFRVQILKEKIIITYCIVIQMHCNFLLYYPIGPSCMWAVDNKFDSMQHHLPSIILSWLCTTFLCITDGLYCINNISLIYNKKPFYFHRARWNMVSNCGLLTGK